MWILVKCHHRFHFIERVKKFIGSCFSVGHTTKIIHILFGKYSAETGHEYETSHSLTATNQSVYYLDEVVCPAC